jgi:hypothetical protein
MFARTTEMSRENPYRRKTCNMLDEYQLTIFTNMQIK